MKLLQVQLRKLKARYKERFNVHVGDVTDEDLILEIIKNVDSVVNCVGPCGIYRANNSKADQHGLLCLTTKHCVKAMMECGVARLVVLAGSLILNSNGLASNLMWCDVSPPPPFMKKKVEDMVQTYKVLLESPLNYAVVCPGVVKFGSPSRRFGVQQKTRLSRSDCVAFVENTPTGVDWETAVTRESLAALLFQETALENDEKSALKELHHTRVRIGCYDYTQKGFRTNSNSYSPMVSNGGARTALNSVGLHSQATSTCMVTYPRQVRDTIGYCDAMLDSPDSRWGSLKFHEARPSIKSGVRQSRLQLSNPTTRNLDRFSSGNLNKRELLGEVRKVVKTPARGEAISSPRSMPLLRAGRNLFETPKKYTPQNVKKKIQFNTPYTLKRSYG